MAILTKYGMNTLLRRIMETGGMTEDMEKDIQRLKDDFDEREGILRRYGEVYDGEDRDEYDYTEKENKKDWESEYRTLEKRYLDKFFGEGANPSETSYEEIMNDQETDVKRDSEPQTFDELLFNVEG